MLGLVATLVERQIVVAWETGRLPHPAGSDPRPAIDQLLGRGAQATETGTNRIRELDGQLAAHETALRERANPLLPLERLTSSFGLSPTEERVLHIALAAELSLQVRSLLRYFVGELRRPMLDRAALEGLVYGASGRATLHYELGPRSPLLDRMLLETLPGADSFMFEGLRVSPRLVELATGIERVAPDLEHVLEYRDEPASFDQIVAPQALRDQLTGLVQQGGFALAPAIVLAGAQGSGRRSLLGAAARAAGKRLLLIQSSALPRDPAQFLSTVRGALREATLLDALPVFVDIDTIAEADAPDRTRERALDIALASWRQPIAATAGVGAAQPMKIARGVIVVDVPPLGEANREALWKQVLAGRSDVDTRQLAARYPVTPGMLMHASNAASTVAATRDGRISEDDIQLGLRSAMDEAVSTLGTRIDRAQRWEDLVAPREVMDSLKEFISRIQYRRRVFDEWGFADKYTKGLGLSALFTGPPGTGKTMAASLIAGKLALDIYQVDVSRLVSKFIGETEKNLARVFDAAENGQAIILFDEADAMFAKRGEVRSSVDRYANLEVNYLLQRLERFSGIAILTTNLASSIDSAFKRRISFTIEFPMPDEKERARIWQTHLPTRAAVAGDFDFEWLARRHEMSGGHIRNAVLRAAFLAAAESSPIKFDHLKRAGEIEALAMGKVH